MGSRIIFYMQVTLKNIVRHFTRSFGILFCCEKYTKIELKIIVLCTLTAETCYDILNISVNG